MLSVRPRVTELAFVLYGRPLHPELFEIRATRHIARGDYQARLDITNTGHIITWNYEGLTWTEVATAAHHPLPTKRRLMFHNIKGELRDEVVGRGGVRYEWEAQLEHVSPEVFWVFQHELNREAPQQGLFFRFDPSGRMPLGAMSFLYFETRAKSLLVQAFHTFPDDCAVVKSKTVIRLP